MKGHTFWLSALIFGLIACSGPEPILYPNAHLANVGETTAEKDIAECRELAEEYGASAGEPGEEVATSTAVGGGAGAATGAVGGAILGSAGTGAAVGAATGATAGLIRGLFKENEPSQVHVRFVEKCLRDRGYEPIGWE
ncbi:MAG: glycine zipper family protein [Kiloniellales bacterium]|nr:glycine zipper family protein [Kiloniellales bacterium]